MPDGPLEQAARRSRDRAGVASPEKPWEGARISPMDMRNEPNLDDPAEAWAHRIMEHLKTLEPDENRQFPRFVVVAETPPVGEVFVLRPFDLQGRIGLASTADDAIDTHRLLCMGAGAVRNGMDDEIKARARAMWDQAEVDFRRRN